MSGLSTIYATAVANHFFRGDAASTAQAQPNALFLALHTADPTDAGKSVDEVVGGSYIRPPVSFSAPVTDVDGNTYVTNSGTIAFTGLPNCVVTHIAIWTAQLGGVMLWSYPVFSDGATPTGEYEFNANDSLTIPAETLEIVIE